MRAGPSEEIDVVEVDDAPADGVARRMLGRYELLAEIAKGGMGTVYLARFVAKGGFERLLAVKLLHPHLADDDAFITLLLDEARTAANIHHPNAVAISDVAESRLGHYLVMDYVDGFPLAEVLTRPGLEKRDRIRLGVRFLVDAAHGLHAAHTAKDSQGRRLGIVHRDVSPQNILVGTDGLGRIADFGIALAASRVGSSRPGSIKGKPQYMAPEQAQGQPCDARTDVFALGVITWELLTFEQLFFGDSSLTILLRVIECDVPSPLDRDPTLPPALAHVVMRALSRRPDDRYASARDFATALERAAEEAGLVASSQEAEELIARLFQGEIAARDAAVRAHVSRRSGATVPLERSDLVHIGKLIEPSAVAMATPAPDVRSAQMTLGATMAVVAPSQPALPMTGEIRARRMRLGGALGLGGVAALALAVTLAVAGAGGHAPVASAAVTTEPAVLAPPTPVAEPRTVPARDAIAVDHGPDLAPPERALPEPALPELAAPAPRVSVEALAPTPSRRRTRASIEGAAEAPATVASEPAPTVTPAVVDAPVEVERSAPPVPSRPTLEANPYR